MSHSDSLMKMNQQLQERLRVAEETLEAIRSGDVDAIIVHGSKGDQLYSLTSPEHPYQVFIEGMSEGAVILSPEGSFLYSNPAFCQMIGISSEKLIGHSILNFIQKGDQDFFMESLRKIGQTRSEFSFINQEGKIYTVILSVFKGICEDSEQLCLLLTDITKLKRAQHLIQASEAITKVLSENTTLSVVSHLIIELLNNYLGWEVMIIWVWNADKRALDCMEITHIPNLDIAPFVEKTRLAGIEKNLISSHVWSSYRPIWIEDVTADSSFLRRNEAIKTGIHGALAFPFYQESRLAGVVELFRRAPFKDEVDDLMLNLISSLGIEIGLYIQRIFSNERQLQLSIILEHSLSCIYTLDHEGVITSWNPGAEKVYGWKAREIIGTHISKLYPNRNPEELGKLWERIQSGDKSEYFQGERVSKHEKVIWVEQVAGPIHDPFGKVVGICVIEQDVTSERVLAETLRLSEEKYRSFIEMTEDWIWEVDQEGIIHFSNQAVYTILDYRVEEILGKSLFHFLALEEREKIEKQFLASINQKRGWVHLTLPFIRKDGTTCWLQSNATVLLDQNRNILGFRGASRDITTAKNLERIKNEFISVLSHELRTPLTSIHGALTLLTSKEMKPEEIKALIETAQRNSLRLTQLINDTIDIERIQLGKLQFDFQKMNLREVLTEAIEGSKISAKQNDLSIKIKGELVDAQVKGDYGRLLQVMSNLLSNAIKFSPQKGEIVIGMEIQNQVVKVSISDSGKGIPKEFQPKVFERFAQADSSANRKLGGTGLGLNISKSIIEEHGGTIHFETQIGHGTTFFFELPLWKED